MNNKTGYRKERQRGKRGRETDIEIDLQNGQVFAYAVLCACAKNKNLLSYIRLVTNYARNLILTSPVLISPKPSKKEKLIRNAFFFATCWRSPPIALKSPNQPLKTLICLSYVKAILTPEHGIPVTTQG